MLSACQLLLRQDAATKRARAISLSEGSADLELVLFVGLIAPKRQHQFEFKLRAASEDATFENRERELEEHKDALRLRDMQ